MIVVIRIAKKADLNKKIEETLDKLKLRAKYTCVLLPEKRELMGMVKKVNNFIAYGNIKDDLIKRLIEERGRISGDKKIPKEKLKEIISKIEEIKSGKIKLRDFGIKEYFRLHPPIGGFKKSIKLTVPKGVLGNHKEKINDLLERMI